eukprot:jgi/Undpi1/461/HiC_scaffold_1.g00457.m1
MVRRRHHTSVLAAAALVVCLCCGKAAAAAGSLGSFDAATLGGSQRPTTTTTTSPADSAQRIKEQATALHRAGEYTEAAKEFARAANMLEGVGAGMAPPPALSAIRLSLAAAQLKSGDLRGAEATCSQLLRTPGLARPLRQKASYRRAMARQRQVEEAGVGVAGSRLAQKAYRDAYLSVKLSQGAGGAGPAEGDPKAVGLVALMEAGNWGDGRLTASDREAAKSKADSHLASLAAAAAPATTPGGGMFDFLGAGGGRASGGGGGSGGLPGLGGAGGGRGGDMGGMPGLMDMMGAGGDGAEGMGGLMKMIMDGAGGAGADGGAGGGDGPDKKQMLKMAKKMSKVVKKQLRNPGTQQFVCSFLKQAEPDALKSLAGAAGVPVNEAVVKKVSTYLKEADGKTLESWISFGEIASGVYRRGSQLAVLWSRGVALAGIWLAWVWVRACFAPIVLTTAKA